MGCYEFDESEGRFKRIHNEHVMLMLNSAQVEKTYTACVNRFQENL